MALLGLFGKDWGDHPLADPKHAKEALATLSITDAREALADISAWLESLPTAEGVKPERRWEICAQLDDVGAAHGRRMAREFLTAAQRSRQKIFQDWRIAHDFWSRLTLGYESCLTTDSRGEQLSLPKGALPLWSARLLHAYGTRMKWQQFNYGPVDATVWRRAGNVYLHADRQNASRETVKLYANWPGETSPEQEYLKLLLFHACSMDSLQPLEIELAERLIAHFLPHFSMTSTPLLESVYWVDAAQSSPPCRVLRAPAPAPSLRYFSTGSAHSVIEELRGRIETQHQIPADLPLGGQYPVAEVAFVLAHLSAAFAPVPPQRDHDRVVVRSLLAVIHGLPEILRRLGGDEGEQEGETWLAQDVSAGGFGVQLPLASNDWVGVGTLIGMRPEGDTRWQIGVVRRYSRASASLGAAGIETLGRSPRALTLDCSGLKSPAVLLDDRLGEGAEARLVIEPGAWEDLTPASIELEGRRYRLSPMGLSLQGEGFAVGRYEVSAVEALS